MPNQSLELLTKSEVAKLLGVTPVTIRNYTKSGILKGYKMGNHRVYYKKNEVEKALTEIEV